MTIGLRCVFSVGPVELFVNLLNVINHSGQELTKNVLDFPEETLMLHNVEASRMTMTRAASKPTTEHKPRSAKSIRRLCSLHGVGTHCTGMVNALWTAARQPAVTLYDFFQFLYVFFSASSNRRPLLESELKPHDLFIVRKMCDKGDLCIEMLS